MYFKWRFQGCEDHVDFIETILFVVNVPDILNDGSGILDYYWYINGKES